MQSLLRPGVYLLNRVHYPVKFMFIGLAMLLPLLVLDFLQLSDIRDATQTIRHELQGAVYEEHLRDVMHLVQQHRALSAGFLSGKSEYRDPLLEKQQKVDAAMAGLAEVDKISGASLDMGNEMSVLAEQWQSLKSSVMTLTPVQSYEAHRLLIKKMLDDMVSAEDGSELTLDPQMDSYYLQDLIVRQLPQLSEDMGQMRAVSMHVVSAGAQGNDLVILYKLHEMIAKDVEQIKHNLTAIQKFNASLLMPLQARINDAYQGVSDITTMVAALEGGSSTLSSAQVLEVSTRSIDKVYALVDQASPLLHGVLNDRQTQYQGRFVLAISFMSLVFIATLYAFSALYFSIKNSVDGISEIMRALEAGDLGVRLNLNSHDEMRRVEDSVNAMIDRFREVVQVISNSSQRLAAAAEQLSASTEESSQGAAAQLRQTEAVLDAVSQMTESVESIAANATATSEETLQGRDQVSSGCHLVESASQAISSLAHDISRSADVFAELGKESAGVGSILSVIRSVAEQTNLLALNAAIEAARAGEQGRGFAVVADEVRTLAGRTQESTREVDLMIKRLQDGAAKAIEAMEESRRQSEDCTVAASRARESLEVIRASIGRITDKNVSVAGAAEQQSRVAYNINASVKAIGEINEQSATIFKQTAAASAELSTLAENLSATVAHFKTS